MATTIYNSIDATTGSTAIDLVATEPSATNTWSITGNVGSDQDTLAFEVSNDSDTTYRDMTALVDGKPVKIVLGKGDYAVNLAGPYTNIRAVKTGNSAIASAIING